VEIVSDSAKALEIVSRYYKGPVKYARAVLERWPGSGAVVAYMGGEVVGAEIFYAVELAAAACVHYYVAVVPEYRRRGVASFLVKKVEELCGAGVYMATTTGDNAAALRLFRRLGGLCGLPYLHRGEVRAYRRRQRAGGEAQSRLPHRGGSPRAPRLHKEEVEGGGQLG
jgi:L-amino acid N-acyltransferase YncA